MCGFSGEKKWRETVAWIKTSLQKRSVIQHPWPRSSCFGLVENANYFVDWYQVTSHESTDQWWFAESWLLFLVSLWSLTGIFSVFSGEQPKMRGGNNRSSCERLQALVLRKGQLGESSRTKEEAEGEEKKGGGGGGRRKRRRRRMGRGRRWMGEEEKEKEKEAGR